MAKVKTPRWGWALTGSGHFFKECLAAVRALEDVDLFVSKAAGEVLRMYKQDLSLPKSTRIFRDTTASSPPVGYFYYGVYHTLVLAPATSNTVAKCVYGISDNLATNGMVKVFPRRIDLENTERLKSFDGTQVVETLSELEQALAHRKRELMAHG
jgi:dihydromethanopterin reductase (acceptor)